MTGDLIQASVLAARTIANVRLGFSPKAVEETNMLEERACELPASADIRLTFRPFEIKTVKVSY